MNKPKNEKIWVTYTKKENDRSIYFAYDEKWNKLGKNKNPTELEKLFK